MSRKFALEYRLRRGSEGPTYTCGKYLQNYLEPNLYDPSKAVAINTAPVSRMSRSSLVPAIRTTGGPGGFARLAAGRGSTPA